MTKENGKVTVAVKVPVFGMVTGTKTMEEIISGKAPEKETLPAVQTREMDATAVSAKPPTSADEPKTADEPAPEATDTTGKTAPPAPAAKTSDENLATALVKMGDNYLGVGMKDLAASKYQEALTKYPNTAAAAKAREGLAKCK